MRATCRIAYAMACYRQSLAARNSHMSLLGNLSDRTHKQVGAFFIGFAVLGAFLLLPDASESKSPTLYIVVLGGVFVGVPAALGIALVSGRLRQ